MVCIKQDQSSCLRLAHNTVLHHLFITLSIAHFYSLLPGSSSPVEETYHQPAVILEVHTLLSCLMTIIRCMEAVSHGVIILIRFPCHFFLPERSCHLLPLGGNLFGARLVVRCVSVMQISSINIQKAWKASIHPLNSE